MHEHADMKIASLIFNLSEYLPVIYMNTKPWFRPFGGIRNELQKVPNFSPFIKRCEAC